jgi:hypothetical protein
VMGAQRRGQRGKWRRTKARRKLPNVSKEPQPCPGRQSQLPCSANGESADKPADKLVLSALKYWEVKRDLIEERLAAIRSATATS